ncbi:MAG: DUF4917 family protein [Desulfobacteraceae bacterium]|nr:MAG: DUF4917 family protein [Desulfobacteraceae bacterium]
MPSIRLHNWSEIKPKFRNSVLLLGNGASIAISRGRLDYSSLLKKAIIDPKVKSVFNYFETNDFETVLRMIWQARNINQKLGITEGATGDTYESIRDALIDTIITNHPTYDEVAQHLNIFARFFSYFKIVINLNYDLLTYWARMSQKRCFPKKEFKDCFLHGNFVPNWRTWLTPNRDNCKPVLFFYPHGNLVFAIDRYNQEYKIKAEGENILSSIKNRWTRYRHIPLFVSEGISTMKLNHIRQSPYLWTIYTEVLPSLRPSLVVFGWSFRPEDHHILNAIAKSPLKRIAVSIYKGNRD